MFLRALFLATFLATAAGAASAAPPPPAAAPAVAVANPGHLAVRGADIVGPDGKPIFLRGWNWGHWGSAQPQDAADNAAQGANVVRMPLRWWGAYRTPNTDSRDDAAPGGINPQNLRLLDEYVRWASNAHLWIILFVDSDCGQNSMQPLDAQFCDPQGQYKDRGGHNFFTDPQMKARFIATWRFVAARYKDVPYLGMFEPLPEPGAPSTSPQEITAFYDEVMKNIREVAPGIPFLVGAHTYKANRVAEVYNPAWRDVVYTGNLFLHGKGNGPNGGAPGVQKRLAVLTALRSQRNVPVFVQQVGVHSADDDANYTTTRAVLQMLVDARVGFTYWEYRDGPSPGEYAPFYRSGKDGWTEKRGSREAIGQAFRK